MRIYFCDLCNESVPQADLDRGSAVLRNERVICTSCESAMTSEADRAKAALAQGGAVTKQPASERAGDERAAPLEVLSDSADDTTIMDANIATPIVSQGAPTSTSSAIAVALASVALICAVGASAWFYDLFERRGRNFVAELNAKDDAWREATNSMEVRVTHTIRDATRNVSSIHDSIEGLNARFDALGVDQTSTWSDLRTDFAQLQAKIGELDGVISAGARNDAKLSSLAATAASLHDDVLRIGGRLSALEQAEPSTASAAPAQAPDAEPKWFALLGDLSSQDPGTRWQAVQSLGQTGDPAVAEHLTSMLKDPDIFVRMATARILGDLGATIGVPTLIDALEDAEASVREAAVVSLRSISGRSFRFDPGAKESDRAKRVKSWRDWWKKNADDFLGRT